MRRHRTPAARFGFSGDSGFGIGGQDQQAHRSEWIERFACPRAVATALWAVSSGTPSVDAPESCSYNENDSMTIYFVAGEVSADNHGAALMRSLRELDPGLTFTGRGGPQMQ